MHWLKLTFILIEKKWMEQITENMESTWSFCTFIELQLLVHTWLRQTETEPHLPLSEIRSFSFESAVRSSSQSVSLSSITIHIISFHLKTHYHPRTCHHLSSLPSCSPFSLPAGIHMESVAASSQFEPSQPFEVL